MPALTSGRTANSPIPRRTGTSHTCSSCQTARRTWGVITCPPLINRENADSNARGVAVGIESLSPCSGLACIVGGGCVTWPPSSFLITGPASASSFKENIASGKSTSPLTVNPIFSAKALNSPRPTTVWPRPTPSGEIYLPSATIFQGPRWITSGSGMASPPAAPFPPPPLRLSSAAAS